MEERHRHVSQHPGRHGPGDSPADRLLADLTAFGDLEGPRSSAEERLSAELGDDLLAAVRAELHRLEHGGFPLCTRPRRVA